MVRTFGDRGTAALCDTFAPIDPSALDVDEQLVWDLLENALWAPSPHNTQPWRFVLSRNRSASMLAHEMAVRLETELRRMAWRVM
jgi:nitroreductase